MRSTLHKTAQHSTVALIGATAERQMVSAATAFFVTPTHLLTSFSCLEPQPEASTLHFAVISPDEKLHHVQILRTDPATDLALLGLTDGGTQSPHFLKLAKTLPGIGHPTNLYAFDAQQDTFLHWPGEFNFSKNSCRCPDPSCSLRWGSSGFLTEEPMQQSWVGGPIVDTAGRAISIAWGCELGNTRQVLGVALTALRRFVHGT